MRILNPSYDVAGKATEHADAVRTVLQSSGSAALSGDEIRAALPAIADDLPDPVLRQIARLIGANVEG